MSSPTSAPSCPAVDVQPVAPSELEAVLPALVDLFVEAVNGDTGLGYVAPIARGVSLQYWLSIGHELDAGTRILLVASIDNRIVGSGQIAFPTMPNARHRGELQKLFVDRSLRGQGIGRALVTALHDEARRRGRSLILLSARRGESGERLYRSMGYEEVGVVPGYSLAAGGTRADTVFMYLQLPE